MEKQLEGLREMIDGGLSRNQEEQQMKELYDCLEKEDRKKEAEFISMKEQIGRINSLLDSLNIPEANSVSDRVELALCRASA